MSDALFFDYPTIEGEQFDRYVNEKHENGRWLYKEEYNDDDYWIIGKRLLF